MPDSPGHRPSHRRRLVADLFAEALGRQPADRPAFLDAACSNVPSLRGEVESLLAAHERSHRFLESPDSWVAEILGELDQPAEPGERVGPYRVLRRLGRGGMGAVYLAERADGQFERRVALKLVGGAPRSYPVVRRFLHERRILARLDHRNIARLLDAGVTSDGYPFLAMEYVEGAPLLAYSEQRQLGIEERLRLFMGICAAVHYAHQHLVIHRDLKPANILVTTEGRVKLLDFGIAKLLDPDTGADATTLTQSGFRAMTPEYAAPEQVCGEPVTTATDIYALGAVLYELLTGRRPHRFPGRSLAAVARVLTEEDPRPPSDAAGAPKELHRRLRGDLDVIVLTALRREPELRYASAEALLEDIGRHLRGLPVEARRGSTLYRAGRFVRRNRAAVVAGGLTLVSLAAGLVGTTWQARAAARERDRAVREADKAARVSRFMTDLFLLADPGHVQGARVTVREALDSGRAWIDRQLTDQLDLRSELAFELGEVYYRLGLYQEARDVWQSALAASLASGGETQEPVLRIMLSVIKALEELGAADSAEMLARRSLTILARLPELNDDVLATTHALARLANALRLQGRLREADSVLQQALAVMPAPRADARHSRTVLLTTLAHVRRARGDPAGAEALLREILPTRRAMWGDEHPEVAEVMVNLAAAIADQGRYAEAEPLMRQGLAMWRRLLGESHPDVALARASLADLLRAKGDPGGAERLYRRALEIQREYLPINHLKHASALFGLGRALLDQHRFAEAEPVLREALELRRRTLGANHRLVAEVASALAPALQPSQPRRER